VGEQLRVVGESVTRVDAHDKVTGKARYSVDLEWPDTLHGAVVRSQRAHALIERIDVEAALRRPGVRAVVTADDLEGLFAAFGHHRPDHAILAPGRVRYWGEPVAVVIADTRAQAQDARDDVVVDYEELEALMDAESAMRPGVPLIHPDKPETGAKFGPAKAGRQDTNEAFTAELAWGDVDAALASAPYTVTTTSAYPMLYAYAMEPYSAQARFVEGGLEVVAGAQHPFQVQRDLARVFDLDLNRVRVTSPLIGGGYGSKSSPRSSRWPPSVRGQWAAGRSRSCWTSRNRCTRRGRTPPWSRSPRHSTVRARSSPGTSRSCSTPAPTRTTAPRYWCARRPGASARTASPPCA
jgi:CO/xanthine dehydrogenase Mo-binding subunit